MIRFSAGRADIARRMKRHASLLAKDKLYIVKIEPWYKPRTTGPGSQNNHYHGHKTQLCRHTGIDVDEMDLILKMKAIKRGYPSLSVKGRVFPHSTARVNTKEMGALIDTCHEVAAFLEVALIEESW